MDVDELYLLMLFIFGAGVLSVFFTGSNVRMTNYIAHGMAALGCLAAILCAIFVFLDGTVVFTWTTNLPFGATVIRIDYLSAFFLLLVGVVGFATSIYAWSYSAEYYGRRISVMAALFNAFLLSMVLVVSVSHIVAFIISWEIMAIVSFLLVNHEYEKPANTRAAYIYIVMTHIGTAFIITAFLLLAKESGSMDFARLSAHNASEMTRNMVFVCALIGFGAKAGVMPLHIWLPEAHPAAPSHVSALMSGVMIKMAIYGICRFFLEFLGIGPSWWGLLILLLAIISSVLGVLYALMEHDLKRLLAFSSVENMGIILLGVGAGMVFMSKGQVLLAGLAWTAALYHVFNHAIFKSLLFMATGAVLQATHTTDSERLGGLIKRMPYTAFFFLGGAAVISALPPLNGFVSEWLTFQSLFFLPHALLGVAGKITGGVLVALLGLTGALAAACFVKAFGISFLAKARSHQAEEAREAKIPMLLSMGILAGLCVITGIWPQFMLVVLQRVLSNIPGLDVSKLFIGEGYLVNVQIESGGGVVSTPIIIGLIGMGAVIAFVLMRFQGQPVVTVGETWTCGIVPTARMEYTATGFSKPIRMAFRSILRPQRETVSGNGTNSYFGRNLSYHVGIKYIFTDIFYRPLNQRIINIAGVMKRIQVGSLQIYIGYIMAVTVLVLVWSAGW